MSKIIGVTVGTPTSPSKIEELLKPVKTVNGVEPDENGNVVVEGGYGESDVYILSEGETLDDVPENAKVVIDPSGTEGAFVLYTKQNLTDVQKTQTRENIGAASVEEVGNIEAALDTIIAIQNSLMGGDGA